MFNYVQPIIFDLDILRFGEYVGRSPVNGRAKTGLVFAPEGASTRRVRQEIDSYPLFES